MLVQASDTRQADVSDFMLRGRRLLHYNIDLSKACSLECGEVISSRQLLMPLIEALVNS